MATCLLASGDLLTSVLAGDFNAEEKEILLNNFMDLYDLQNLVKENTCFKSVENPSCVDLFLTNCSNSFQSTFVISTAISRLP